MNTAYTLPFIHAMRLSRAGRLLVLLLVGGHDASHTLGGPSVGMPLLPALFTLALLEACLRRAYRQDALKKQIQLLEVARCDLEEQVGQLEKQNEILSRQAEAAEKYVHLNCHDLKGPVASALGLITLMRLDPDPASIARYLEMQERSLRQLQDLIARMLSRARSTHADLLVEEILFQPLVSRVTASHRGMPGADRLDIRLSYGLNAPFYCEVASLETILSNLVSNAIRYQEPCREDPFLHIRVVTGPGGAHLEVADNGIGIALEHQEKIYDLFYRVGDHPDSSGVGLHSLKEAVTRLNGTVSLQSELGVGTTFRISLPGHSGRNS